MPLLIASYQNIVDADGIGLAITGMSIVFVALVLISLFISALPQVVGVWDSLLPPLEDHHGAAPATATRTPAVGVEDEVVAAIGVAMHRNSQS